MNRKQAPYVLCILLQSLIYGIGNPLTKVAYETITPLWLLAVRFTVTFLVLLPFCGRRALAQLRGTKASVWLPPCLCCAAAYISCNVALSLTSATNVGFIMSLPVLFTPFLAVPVLHRRYDLRRLPLQLAMAAGLFLLCMNGGRLSFGAGEALALLDAFALAGVLVFGERAMHTLDALSLTLLQAGTAMALCVPAALAFGDIGTLSGVSLRSWAVILYLALVCTVGGYWLQNFAVVSLSAQTVSMLQCTQPVMTALVSFFLLREALGGTGLLGAAVIVLCLLLNGALPAKHEKVENREKVGIVE